eukprot:CAMPEP_0185691478 /NCGR_PEP_ID=MMETSP1164-20130828/1864_1 /TAXON_ID=1104430 /ORGANISM="Chrysoreinhardia sp, Strain CCMP2950" /LENGTH=241 /DNA_ID=CAMNT_0028358147 /DNA_START=159 /DNA_END=881 /DNA_ORIENTATION=-
MNKRVLPHDDLMSSLSHTRVSQFSSSPTAAGGAAARNVGRKLLGVVDEPGPQLDERAIAVRDGVFIVLGHLGVRQPVGLIGLEDGVPAEVRGAARRDDLTRRPPVEDADRRARPGREREQTLRVRRFVGVPREQLVEPVVAQFLEKPLAVRPRQPVERVVAQQRVLAHDRAARARRGELAFGAYAERDDVAAILLQPVPPRDMETTSPRTRDGLGFALELGKVELAVRDAERNLAVARQDR